MLGWRGSSRSFGVEMGKPKLLVSGRNYNHLMNNMAPLPAIYVTVDCAKTFERFDFVQLVTF